MTMRYVLLYRPSTETTWLSSFASGAVQAEVMATAAGRKGIDVIGPFGFNVPLNDESMAELLAEVATAIDHFDSTIDHTDWQADPDDTYEGDITECYDAPEEDSDEFG